MERLELYKGFRNRAFDSLLASSGYSSPSARRRGDRMIGRGTSASGLMSRVAPVQTAMRNCTRDEGRSFGFGDQVADSKPPQAAVVKSHGGERCGKAGTRFRQARLREASASEPSMTCRKRLRRCQNRGVAIPPGSAWGDVLSLPKRHPAWRRREAQSGFRKKLPLAGGATDLGADGAPQA